MVLPEQRSDALLFVRIYHSVKKNQTLISPFFDSLDITDTDMVKDYLHRRSPVYPAVEGRIKFVNNVESAASKLTSVILMPFVVSLATVLRTL